MYNSRVLLIILLLIVILPGCGSNDDRFLQGDKAEYQDIMVEREDFPDFQEDFQKDGERHTLKYLGTQFLGEEAIQLWAERYAAGDDSSKIYKWGLDGKRELLAEGISDRFTIGGYDWYLDREGCFYLINTRDETNLLRKLDAQGKELYKVDMTDAIAWRPQAICQTPDGKVYLTVSELNKGYQLAEMDPDTGVVTVLEEAALDPADAFGSGIYLGAGENGPAVCRSFDIQEIDIEQGELREFLSFNGTSYTTAGSGKYDYYEDILDFRIVSEGCAEILKANLHGNPAYVERLSLETVQRTPVVVSVPVVDGWLKRQVVRFNQENTDYHIVIEEVGLSDGSREEEYADELEDYARRVSIRLAVGEGPDILIGEEVLGGNVFDMMEKGVLEDLRPYMERTNIREEDYFPLVFGAWRRGEEIYGICAETAIRVHEGDKDVIGSDIRETVENLLAYQENAVYMKGADSRTLLRMFLEGSESLCGMVDWETGTCDFKGDFFEDLLEAARRYGDDPRKQYIRLAQSKYYIDFYRTMTPSELEEQGMVLAGRMFDEGIHGTTVYDHVLAINANSAQKEGAWEFLCFLLGDEAQKDVFQMPLRRETFEEWVVKQFEYSSDYRHVYISDENRITGEWESIAIYGKEDREFLENEKLPYFRKIMEEARHLPIRPVPVLNIICEEAEHYFNGSKSAAEVAEVIENRVNLYLNERK